MDVYVDVIFEVNFFMDLIIFYLSSKLLGVRVYFGRLIFGAFLSAVLYCLFVFTYLQRFMSGFTAVAMIFTSVIAVYKPVKFTELLFDAFCVTAVSFVVGGTALGVFYYINAGRNHVFSVNEYFPVGILFTACSLAFVVISFVKKVMKNNAVKKQYICNTDIYIEGKCAGIRALVDTGNSLTEPVSGKGVIVADVHSLRYVIPKKLFKLVAQGKFNPNDIFYMSRNEEYANRLRLVPFKSVGEKNGLLLCFTADMAKFENVSVNLPLVALCNMSFSETGRYSAIINPKMFDMGGYGFEKNFCGAYGGRYEGV